MWADLTKDLTFGQMFALSVAAVAILWLLGATIHVVLRERGFGVIGNSLFLVAGGMLGFYMKILVFGSALG
jgi:hypothetical protein